jgi:16S rRNA U516 pseudouridylate synthase RsuA-like enzyme
MFESIDREVTRLHRVAFGDFELGNLQPGEWREAAVPAARLRGQAPPVA